MIVKIMVACAPLAADKPETEQSGKAQSARLASDWTHPMVLPPPGQAVVHVDGRTYHIEELNVCELRENDNSFLFRGTGQDEEGRLLIVRIYRRLAGERTMAPGEDELIQVSVRDGQSDWSNSILRLQRDTPDDRVRRVHGYSESMPAVHVRPDGRAAWASGWIRPEHGSGDLVGHGWTYVTVHCRGPG